METDHAGDSQGQVFCWEQLNRSNRLFRVSHVFAPALCADQLVPLYALFSVFEQICSTVSDEDVARSKLGWWRKEFEPQNRAVSQHPLVKELIQTGADERLPDEPIAHLFYGAAKRISATAPTDMATLEGLCFEMYYPQLQLELALSGPGNGAAAIAPGLLARNGLIQLIRESTQRKEQGGFWWIPLNSLARHGVSREDLVNKPGSAEVGALVNEILVEALAWGVDSADKPASPAKDHALARHFFAISELNSRKLRRLAGLPVDQFGQELSRLGPGDLMSAWKGARNPG